MGEIELFLLRILYVSSQLSEVVKPNICDGEKNNAGGEAA